MFLFIFILFIDNSERRDYVWKLNLHSLPSANMRVNADRFVFHNSYWLLMYNNFSSYNCHSSGHHPSSCLLFKIRRFGTWFCLCLQVEPIDLGPLNRASPCLQTQIALSVRPSLVGLAWRRRRNPVSETSCFKQKKKKDGYCQELWQLYYYINITNLWKA
jgi:hypothetical protein